MITTMKRCEQGINGGFSPTGQLAAIIGGLLIAIISLGFGTMFGAEAVASPAEFILGVTLIGFIGCQIDSVFGAVLENRGLIGKGTVNAMAICTGAILAWFVLPNISF